MSGQLRFTLLVVLALGVILMLLIVTVAVVSNSVSELLATPTPQIIPTRTFSIISAETAAAVPTATLPPTWTPERPVTNTPRPQRDTATPRPTSEQPTSAASPTITVPALARRPGDELLRLPLVRQTPKEALNLCAACAPQPEVEGDLAFGKPVFASSVLEDNYPALATDGIAETAWQSRNSRVGWLYVDMEAVQSFNTIITDLWVTDPWGFDQQTRFIISNDLRTWLVVAQETISKDLAVGGYLRTLRLSEAVSARYIGIYGDEWGGNAIMKRFMVLPPTASLVNASFNHLELDASPSTAKNAAPVCDKCAESSEYPGDLAFKKPTYASNFSEQNFPNRATDGDPFTVWETPGQTGVWFMVDLESAQSFNTLSTDLQTFGFGGLDSVVIVSDDMQTWRIAGEVPYTDDLGSPVKEFALYETVTARYVGLYARRWADVNEVRMGVFAVQFKPRGD